MTDGQTAITIVGSVVTYIIGLGITWGIYDQIDVHAGRVKPQDTNIVAGFLWPIFLLVAIPVGLACIARPIGRIGMRKIQTHVSPKLKELTRG